jgi:hypothetical protein
VRAPGHPRQHDQQAVRLDGPSLSLQGQRADLLDVHRLADEAVGGLAQDDLPGPGRLLQVSDDVHHLARELARTVGPGHDLPGLDRGTQEQAEGRVPFELLVEAGHPVAELGRGPHGPQCVVLVAVEDGGVVVTRKHPPQEFGVVALPEAGGPLDVAADDRDEAPQGRIDQGFEGGSARPAEPRADRVGLPTLRTGDPKRHDRVYGPA